MIKKLFDLMFEKKNKLHSPSDFYAQLKNTPEADAYHLFSARTHVDYGYGAHRLSHQYGALEYVGSTHDKNLIEQIAALEPRYTEGYLTVLKGRLMDVKPIVETYEETIKKQKVVGFVLE